MIKIRKHGGFFLSNVVGLGKTVTTAMIVTKLLDECKGEILIIAPPAIKDEWEETFNKFNIGKRRSFHFQSYRNLDKIKNKTEQYKIVIIDDHISLKILTQKAIVN